MKILLIGGTGVLSSSITAEAIKCGYDVTMINRGRRKLPDNIHLIKTDRNNFPYIKSQIEECSFDAIIDFLCYTPKDAEESFYFYSKYAKQYIFISSCAVYDKTYPGMKNEDSPKGLKIWNYSTNKWACEQRVAELAKNSKCKLTVVRPCVTYDDTRIPYGITPPYGFHWTLCARILAGKPIIRWNHGATRSNMMRVEDFAVGLVGLIGNSRANGEAFNICGDEMPSFNDVLDVLQDVLKKEIKTVDISSEFYAKELPSRAGEILGGRSIDALNSNDKIKSVVPEFKQTISLKDGIAKTILAYKEQNYQKGIDWLFDAECDRIIKRWCEQNKIATKGMNLKFIDYLGNATFKDRYTYLVNVNKNFLIIKIMMKVVSLISKILKRF